MSDKKNIVSILNYPIVQFFLMLPYLKPACFEYMYPTLDQFFDVLRILSFVIIFFIYIFNHKLTKIILAISLYELFFIVSTFINGGDFYRIFATGGSVIFFCMLTELCITQNISVFINTLTGLLAFLCTTNLILVILIPGGMYKTTNFYQNWLLGYDNVHSVYILLLLCVFLIKNTQNNRTSLNSIIGMFIFSASAYITWSVSSVVAVTAFIILYLLYEMKFNFKFLNMWTYTLINIIFFFLLIIFRVQDFFEYFIVKILKKDLTLSTRTIAWDYALYWFRKSPYIGNGVSSDVVDFIRLGGYSHCHNYFLQILYQSGYCGMFFFLIIMLIVIRRLTKINNKYSYIISASIFSILIVYQVESFTVYTAFFFSILTMAYHIDKFTSNTKILNREVELK